MGERERILYNLKIVVVIEIKFYDRGYIRIRKNLNRRNTIET